MIHKDHVSFNAIRSPSLPREMQREMDLSSLNEGKELHDREEPFNARHFEVIVS